MIFQCPKCYKKLSKLHYVFSINGDMHLAGHCEEHKTMFVKRVEDLKIPTRLSKKACQPKLSQPKLF